MSQQFALLRVTAPLLLRAYAIQACLSSPASRGIVGVIGTVTGCLRYTYTQKLYVKLYTDFPIGVYCVVSFFPGPLALSVALNDRFSKTNVWKKKKKRHDKLL